MSLLARNTNMRGNRLPQVIEIGDGVAAPRLMGLPSSEPGRARPGKSSHDSGPTLVNSIGMKLALIPAGEFWMGSAESEKGRRDDERLHRVRISKPFYMGAFEVTQEEYARVMGANPSYFSPRGDGKNKVKWLDTGRCPVEQVSWDDAREFCRRLSELPAEKSARHVYRLPTEAQWEYACRAGTTTPFFFGRRLNGIEANCLGSSPYGTDRKGPNLQRPTRVGSYAPNAFGLFDMHGNVWEWCWDWKGDYAAGAATDPAGPARGSFRVIRGGGWVADAVFCRSAGRGASEPANRHGRGIGFRVVRQ